VIIELKYYGHDDRLEQRVIEIVERLGMEDEIVTKGVLVSMRKAIFRVPIRFPRRPG
jgi:hypothetical protein